MRAESRRIIVSTICNRNPTGIQTDASNDTGLALFIIVKLWKINDGIFK